MKITVKKLKEKKSHTPAPWWFGREAGNRIHFANDAESPIFTLLCGRPEALANARLIAAAPELLAAAKMALSDMVGWDTDERVYPSVGLLRAAIRKAESKDEEKNGFLP